MISIRHCLIAAFLCLGLPAAATPACAAKTPPPATLQAPPRNEEPMEEFTRYFTRSDFEVSGPAENFLPHEPGDIKYKLAFYMFQPEGAPYPEGLKFPLVLVLHDASGLAYAAEHLVTRKMQVAFPAFVVVPVQPRDWIWATPRSFAQYPSLTPPPNAVRGLEGAVQLVNALAAQYPVDPKRIYVIGCAEGGFGAYGTALRYPDIFAASVALNGGWTLPEARYISKVPMCVYHGVQNPIVPIGLARALTSRMHEGGGRTLYNEFPDMGNECASLRLYDETMWKWLFSQRKK